MAKDFYAILGVSKSASETEIKQAYRKLSKELHPDKHKGDKGKEAKFKEVNEAYEVLSDPKKKENYDRFGSADFGGMGGGGQGFGGFQGGFQGFDPSQFSDMGFGDMFESFFGGQSRRGNDGRGRTVQVDIEVPFAATVTGDVHRVTFKTHVTCSECSGNGGSPGAKIVTCTECGGTGAVTRNTRSIFGAIQQSVVCPTCHGSGKIPEKPCKKCKGEGRVSEQKSLDIRIPAGIDDGQSLRLKGEGEAGRQGAAAGDLLVRVQVKPDARFVREGDDIRSSVSITVIDAVLGTEKDIETVHGKKKISIPAGTQPGQVLRLKGEGMPVVNTSKRGDHYATIDIAVPTKLSREEKKLYEELKKSQD